MQQVLVAAPCGRISPNLVISLQVIRVDILAILLISGCLAPLALLETQYMVVLGAVALPSSLIGVVWVIDSKSFLID